MARERKHRGRTRRGGRFLGLYVFFTAILVVLAIIAGCIVFFKVNTVEVYVRDSSGDITPLAQDDIYTQEEIMEAAGIHIGDNLFLLDKNRTVISVLNRLPYVSSVSLHKKLPGTLTLTVAESSAVAAVQMEDKSWWLMDINGKLLEQVENDKGCIVLEGLTLLEPQAGQVIGVPDGSDPEVSSQSLQKDSLLQLLPHMQDYDLLKNVVSINLSSDSEMVMNYADRLRVKILLEADFGSQVKLFAEVLDYIDANWSEEDTGTLDMTYDDGRLHLVPDS